MKLRTIFLRMAVLALSLSSAAASASELTSSDILIPVVARTNGANGSVWRTDLTVTNLSRQSAASTIVTFSGGGEQKFQAYTLAPRETLVLDDVLFSTFAADDVFGIIRITSATPGALLTANARIYNRGSQQGEFGQGVQGLPVDGLGREHFLTGLSGLGGNRVNVGVSNPWDVEAGFTIGLYDRDGEFRGSFNTIVGPRDVLQFNDVFAQFPAGPLEGATIHIVSSIGVYPYASVVRNDSGDARFLNGTGFATSELLQARCSSAAPVTLAPAHRMPTGRWIVGLNSGETDPAGRAALLAAHYGFTVDEVIESMKWFVAATLTPEQMARLRCDPAVALIQQDHVTRP